MPDPNHSASRPQAQAKAKNKSPSALSKPSLSSRFSALNEAELFAEFDREEKASRKYSEAAQ